ncbi:MAG: cell division ATPase MinD [Candidatus Altiarchaeales archaeon]|nr:cell division ATPase MinD [Candidatus Altiarchaeota archaeon]MCG2783406.1 cell division ATPase MinD [Candidatus Altiarchaeales archaeon]MBU4266564.1 cell division ATPase MinD [Candidatus Altiarchaeota archaeon]MBU4341709.1 cell division ATPase MinD [Candidatus Altiarchaeota archaeon]MBU4406978.1 cell division ATPase MinD [Candidatus Altiarchaeota archaeon]
MVRVIGVLSGKGGVGKTTLVSNLGVSLAQEGKNVAIVDANLTGANLGLHFGLLSYPVSIHDVMNGGALITDAMYKHPSGVDIIPASLSIEHIDTEPKNLRSSIDEFLGDKDFVLIDAATGLDRETLNAIDMSDEVLIVTHPELPTISDALRTKTIAEKYGKDVIGIVLNRVNRKDDLNKDNVSSFFELPVIGAIPDDPVVRKSIEAKNPVVLSHPNHRVSQEVRRVSSHILGKKYVSKNNGGLMDRLLAMFKW